LGKVFALVFKRLTGLKISPLFRRPQSGSGQAPAKSKDTNMVRIVRGIVVPISWGDDGEVLTIAIDTHQEERYVVVENARGQQLKKLLRRRVYVEGRIKALNGGSMTIEVEYYRPEAPF
jgi:hypothetical protein